MSARLLQTLGLQPAVRKAVEEKAKLQGQTVAEYVRSIIERDVLADQAFDEILRPVRTDFRENGVTEDELDRIVDRARKSVRPSAR